MPRSALLFALLAASAADAETPRADPPDFTAEDRAAFFDNAFEALVGERPDYAARRTEQAKDASATPGGEAAAWSALVDAETLETEIKRQATRLNEAVRSGAAFKAGGYRDAGDALGMIALAMAVTAEHDGRPRWRDEAAGLRALFGGFRATADDTAFREATARAADLEELIRGGRPATPDAPGAVDWEALVDREMTMRRMGPATEDRLRAWLADRRQFRRNADEARHEAQVLALLAEAIARPGAPDAEGDDYRAYAAGLRRAATELAEAAEAGDFDAARAAMPAVDRACSDCHADYRG